MIKMKCYEFWLREQFREQPFTALCGGFYNLGRASGLVYDPRDEDDNPIEGPCVYAISWNENTHWIQLLVDDNTPQPIITAIEARINGLKDNEPLREYGDDAHYEAPIETPKHFTLERVLRVRQKQKDRTLGRIEDVA